MAAGSLATKAQAIEQIHPRSLKFLSEHLQGLIRGRLWAQVLIGMMLGLLTGIALGPTAGWVPAPTAATVSSWLALPGQLFLALIQMIVIPLVFASIIRGLAASEDVDQLRKVGLRAVFYFVGTTTVAIVIGLSIALIVKPGQFVDSEMVRAALSAPPPASVQNAAAPPTLEELPGKILTLLPTNPLGSMVENDMMRVVIFGMVVGIALVLMAPEKSRPLLDLLGSLQEVCMTVVRWAMLLAPFAVFGLMAQLTAKIGIEALVGMAVYVLTVLAGLLLLVCGYLILAAAVGGKGPLQFLSAVRELLLLAFSTSSSAAVMPLSIRTAEEKLGVRPSVAQFVVPLGATINMDGTALYQGVAAIFLAQVFGIEISTGGMLLIVVTAIGASIGAPATPGVGIVILSLVLGSVGIPASGIALILGVDRILDMSRTAVNVCGDQVASLVMDKWVGGSRPARLELAEERVHEQIRARTGQDILIQRKHSPAASTEPPQQPPE